jgi:hypothetical protein
MGNSPLEMAELYYHWVNDNITFEEENMKPPGYNEQSELLNGLPNRLGKARSVHSGEGLVGESKERLGFHEQEFIRKWKELASETGVVWDTTLKQQVQSIIKTAQSEIFENELHGTSHIELLKKHIQTYNNAFNKLLEL